MAYKIVIIICLPIWKINCAGECMTTGKNEIRTSTVMSAPKLLSMFLRNALSDGRCVSNGSVLARRLETSKIGG